VEREIDEAIRIAQVHLHPVELCAHIHGHTMSQNLKLLIDGLNAASISFIVQYFFEQGREALAEDLAYGNRG